MRKINYHPTLEQAPDIKALCQPLLKFDINYFTHVNIDEHNKFAAISNHPEFHKLYLKKAYYHADIHLADVVEKSKYVIWDTMEYQGESLQMHEDAEAFGIRHTFTIIDKSANDHNYYHFSTSNKDFSFNQVYLNNLDLLELFIEHFKEAVGQSKTLSKAYQIKFSINENLANYSLMNDHLSQQAARTQFLQAISHSRSNQNDFFVIHKDSRLAVSLSKQQAHCLMLLVQGMNAAEIAEKLQLSPRTVYHYLDND